MQTKICDIQKVRLNMNFEVMRECVDWVHFKYIQPVDVVW